MAMASEDTKPVAMLLPAAPPGGGYLVLSEVQIGCWELVCAIKSAYPLTKIIVNEPMPLTLRLPPPVIYKERYSAEKKVPFYRTLPRYRKRH